MGTTKTLSGSNSTLSGYLVADTVIATGTAATLSGLGANSLVAAGNGDYLAAGVGNNTLRGASLSAASSILQGNGLSTLQYAGAVNTFLINNSVAGAQANNGFTDYKTDFLQAATLASGKIAAAGASVIRTNLNKFDLGNTLNHGAGVLGIRNLTYTGSGNATLVGNTLNDWIQGGTGTNSLVAASLGYSTLDAHISTKTNTLAGNGFSSLLGGTGNDTYVIKSGDKIFETSTGGTDLVSLTGSATIYNLGSTINGAGIGNIENLVYAGTASEISLTGNSISNSIKGAGGNKNNYLSGGNGGKDTLDASTSTSTVGGNTLIGNSLAGSSLVGGSGKNTFFTSNSADTITAGATSRNTIVSNAAKIDLSTLSGNLKFDSISYVGYGNTTILGNSLGKTTINAGNARAAMLGDGGSTLGDTLIGSSSGVNTFLVTAAGLPNDSIAGGAGIDTLQLTTAANGLADSAFSKVSSVEVLQLTGSANNIVIGNTSRQAGISTIVAAGAGGDTISAAGLTSGSVFIDASQSSGPETLIAGSGSAVSTLIGSQTASNAFYLSTAANLGSDSVYGNLTRTDTLSFTSGDQAINDADLTGTRLRSIEVISLTGANNTVRLGANAQAGGISTLIGGTGPDYLSAEGMTVGNIVIDGSKGSAGDTLAAGSGSSKSTLIGNDSSGANNYFRVSGSQALANTSILGGSASSDVILVTTGAQNITDSAFTKSSGGGLDALILTGGNNNITLGTAAENSFLNPSNSFSITGGTQGGDKIDLSGVANLSTFVDESRSTGNNTLVASSGGSTLIGGSSANSSNLFIANSSQILGKASIVGGGGIDTLQIKGNAQTITSFSRVAETEILHINGRSNSITLTGADLAGISTIVGTGSSNSVNGFSYSTSADSLTFAFGTSAGRDTLTGGKTGNIFQIKDRSNLLNSSITGGGDYASDNTLQLVAGGQTLGDSDFSSAGFIGKLVLGSAATGNNVILGNTAGSTTGISTIIAGTGRDTINAANLSNSDNHFWIDGSQGSGDSLIGSTLGGAFNTLIGSTNGTNVFVVAGISGNSIVGGAAGNDTLAFTTGIAVDDASFAQLSDIGALKFLQGNNAVTLGSNALIAGISTVIGGLDGDTGGDTFDASGYNNASLLFQITDQNYLSTSSIVGSAGSTTLQFTNDGISVTDADLANVQNIKVLQTANGNNRILISDNFQNSAGIVSVIGGTGSDTIDIADSDRYNPTSGSSILTYDLSKGQNGYDFIGSISNFPYTRIIGGSGKNTLEIADAGAIGDSLFANQYQAKAGSLILSDAGSNSATLANMAGAAGISTVYLGNVGDSISATSFSGNLTIQGGAGNDLVQTSMNVGSNLTLNGGHQGTDTLHVINSSARSITSLAGSFDALAVTAGNNFIALAESVSAGITSIYGGTGADTISVKKFTKGINIIVAQTALGSGSTKDSLMGGNGNDTLTIAEFPSPPSSPVVNEATFARTSSIEALALNSTGGYSATFGVNALKTGISTVYGSTGGNDYFNATNFIDPKGIIKKGLRFVLPGSQQLATDTIQGTIYNDTLALASGSQTVDDSKFANVSGVESFQLGDGGNSVGLDTNAKNAGITAVVGGSGNNSITQGDNFTTTATISGGGGNDTLTITDRASLRRNFLDGGTGTNTIVFTKDGQTVTDADLGRTSSIQVVRTANGSNVISLGSTAAARGLSSLYGGTGNDSFDAAALGAAAYLDGGDGNNTFIGGTTVVGGAGNDSIVVTAAAASISSGGGNDLISFNSYDNLISSSLVDGGAGPDTLAIGSGVTLNDSLSHFSNIEALALASTSVVTLGHNAQSAGINQIILGTGPDTVDAKAYTAQLTLDASAYTGASSLGDSLIGGTSGTDFIFSTAAAVLNSTIKGGTGIDTLAFSSGGQNVTDNSFTFLSSVEALSLSGSSNTVTVNLTAQGAGLRSVSLGGSGDTFTQDSPFNNALSVIGGAGADNIILSRKAQLAVDSIADGGGKDTLTIQESSSFQSSDFSQVSGIEALQLTSNSSFSLGGTLSFESILGGTGLDTFVQTTPLTKATSIDGGAGGDLFSLQSVSYLSSESLLGGDGVDTLAIASAVTGFNDSLGGITSMEVLSLSGANDSISLQGNATLAGIQQVFLGNGNNSVAVDSQAHVLSYSSIAGGSGTDTLSILGQVSALGDTGFSGISSIDVLDISKSGLANSVTLGSNANAAGIRTLISGSASDVVAIQSTNQLGADYSLDGGIGTDTLSILDTVTGFNDGFGNLRSFEALTLSGATDNLTFGSAAQTAGITSVSLGAGSNKIAFTYQSIFGGTSVTGGSGSDTIALLGLGSPISLGDSDFSKLTSIDAIDLSQVGSASRITVGSTAENNASISTIVGSSAADTITAALYQNAITINDSLNISAAASLTTGAGSDLIILGGQDALTLSTIEGNAGTNTLTIVDEIAGNDTALFSNLSHIQLLSLSGSDDTATLGNEASSAGISTVIAGGGNDNIAFATQDYFTTASLDGGTGTDTVSIGGPVSLNDAFNRLSSVQVLDVSSSGVANQVTLGDRADDDAVGLRKVISGAGNDSFAVANQTQFSHNTIVGGGGTDTLAILDQVTGLSDSGFANLSSIEVLNLSGSGLSNSLTLGTAAKNTAGIQTIISGSGDDLINVKSQLQIGANYLVDGGTGTDTLAIQDQAIIGSNGFASVLGIEVLSFDGVANEVTLDSSAAGITTVLGGNFSDRIAFDTKVRFSAASIIGGDATDTLAILDSVGAANFTAGDLSKISSIEVLDISASKTDNTILIDTTALDNGIRNEIGGSGRDSIDASAHTGATRLTLDGGVGAPNTLIGGASTEFFLAHNGDSIVGAGGNDTLTTYDSVFTVNTGANIKNIFYTGSGTIFLTGNNDGDALNGGSLNDTIVGGTGSDSIDGGAGADSMAGGAGDDLYFVDNLGDKVVENPSAGTDTVVANLNNYTLAANVEVLSLGSASSILRAFGNNRGNTILGNNNSDSLFGGTGNDIILGGSGNDTIIGGGGSDCLIGGAGRNSLVGAGTGNDTFVIRVADGLNTLYSARSNDTIVTNQSTLSANTDVLIVDGSFSTADQPLPAIGVNPPNPYGRIKKLTYIGNDAVTLIGNSIGNTLTSGGGDDTLVGSSGNTSMAGGSGDDVYIWGRNDAAYEASASGYDTIVSTSSDVTLSSSTSIEWVILQGSQALSAHGSDNATTIVGNDSDNNLYGGTGNDCLVGGGGNNLLDSGGGSNTLVGGSGNDTFVLGAVYNLDGSISSPDVIDNRVFGGTDEVDVAASVDLTKLQNIQVVRLLETASLGDNLRGFNNFAIIGNSSSNTLLGNSGNNSIDGGTGVASMVGGVGNDTYVVRNSGGSVIERSGEGQDLVISYVKDYTLSNNLENLIVNGGTGATGYGNQVANSIVGASDAVSLYGMGGADTILGGGGNDYLVGGFDNAAVQSAVSIVGGGGNDTYVVAKVVDALSSFVDGSNRVVEAPFGGSDKVILNPFLVSSVTPTVGSAYTDIRNSTNFTGTSSVQTMLFLDKLNSSNLNYNFAGDFSDFSNLGSFSFNQNYFYAIPENVEKLDVISRNITVNGLDYGDIQPNFIYGNNQNNYISIQNEDSVSGGFANYIDGGYGVTTMAGGLGNDTYIVHNSNDLIIESSGEGTDQVNASVSYDLITCDIIDPITLSRLSTIENLTLLNVTESISGGAPVTYPLTGTDLDFNGTGNGVDNRILGNAGNNYLSGVGGNDTIRSRGGNDTIDGGTGNNLLTNSGTALEHVLFMVPDTGLNTIIGTGSDTLQLSADALIFNDSGITSNISGINALSFSGLNNSVVLASNASTEGIQTVIGGTGHDTFDVSGYSTNPVTLQAWSGVANDNLNSDTITAGNSAADLFILGDGTGNAYGIDQLDDAGNYTRAVINGFKAGASGDQIQLHDFGGVNAGTAGYQTVSGGSGIVDIYTYQGTTTSYLVAELHVASGTFDLTQNARII